ncbi:Uncharacterized conserved protein (UCP012943) [Zea mays]|uniref:Uncharacterized conserved protein (UCP012943) n=3 Tax=Zea mays TaxID=4577 RepID=K7TVX6_MAIZE|nr:Uncharacterized conserved protein (UCP012943) [Zea mays]
MKQLFGKASVLDSEPTELQALALPVSGHPSSGIFMDHLALDSDASMAILDEWTEPAKLVLNSSALLTEEHQSVLDAFHLLREDAYVQKMVMALSTDKAVWNAVMNNDVVQEFKRSFKDAKETYLKGSSTPPPPGFMMWVMKNVHAKIREFFKTMFGLTNILFQAGDHSYQAGEQNYDFYDCIVRMSFMLTVFVFVMVTVARIR